MIQVEIRWPINPFRGDRFAEGWLPAAELYWELLKEAGLTMAPLEQG